MNIQGLDQKICELTGIGQKTEQSYNSIGIYTISDLIQYPVREYEDRTKKINIGLCDGNNTNTIVKVISKSYFGKDKRNVRITVQDTESKVIADLLGFNRSFLNKIIFVGGTYTLYATMLPNLNAQRPQYSKFELKPVTSQTETCNGGIIPFYSIGGSLTQNTIRRDIKNAFSRISGIENPIPDYLFEKYSLLPFYDALKKSHFPTSEDDIIQSHKSLAFIEVYLLQQSFFRKSKTGIRRSIPVQIYKEEQEFIARLPFQLTTDQLSVLSEIRTDMSSATNMNRLLQGDVGSGKTLVAWISTIHAISEGRQVAFMAPTELLAKQHAQSAAKLFNKTGITVAYLDGQVHGKSRAMLLEQLSHGNIDLLIGTHALFSKDVAFKNLGFIIIDEQHKFGVEQRNSLFNKGDNPDVLLMTATPIPRTLALTLYGNLNVSTIKTMPQGRLPIKTYVVNSSRREEMYNAVRVELERGHQAYFVYPRIEAAEDEDQSNLRDVQTMYKELSEKYSAFKGALIHSKLDDDQKMQILNDFANKQLNFLVATSVVEVGIDVKDATCMVIEHAEIFGLSALHQLRGRVGRSTLQSWCFMVYEDSITEEGKKRLSVLRRSTDGFEIAEEDLKIRGPGEISGLRQSGFVNLKYATLDNDLEIFASARDEAMKASME